MTKQVRFEAQGEYTRADSTETRTDAPDVARDGENAEDVRRRMKTPAAVAPAAKADEGEAEDKLAAAQEKFDEDAANAAQEPCSLSRSGTREDEEPVVLRDGETVEDANRRMNKVIEGVGFDGTELSISRRRVR